MPASLFSCYVNMYGKSDWNPEKLNAADETLKYTHLKTKATGIQQACRRADDAFPFSMIGVVDLALSSLYASVAVSLPLVIRCGETP